MDNIMMNDADRNSTDHTRRGNGAYANNDEEFKNKEREEAKYGTRFRDEICDDDYSSLFLDSVGRNLVQEDDVPDVKPPPVEGTKYAPKPNWRNLIDAFDKKTVLNTILRDYLLQEEDFDLQLPKFTTYRSVLEHMMVKQIEEEDGDKNDEEESLEMICKSKKSNNDDGLTFKYNRTQWNAVLFMMSYPGGGEERTNKSGKNRVLNGLPFFVLESAVSEDHVLQLMKDLAGFTSISLISILQQFCDEEGQNIGARYRSRLNNVIEGLRKMRVGSKKKKNSKRLQSANCFRYSLLKYKMEKFEPWKNRKKVMEEFVKIAIQEAASNGISDPYQIREVNEIVLDNGKKKIAFWKFNQDRETEKRWMDGLFDQIWVSRKTDLFLSATGKDLNLLVSYYLPTRMQWKEAGEGDVTIKFLESDFGDRLQNKLREKEGSKETGKKRKRDGEVGDEKADESEPSKKKKKIC